MNKIILFLSLLVISFCLKAQNGVLNISNIASNGPIGTAAATVDVGYTDFKISQTTAGITATVPSLTNAGTSQRKEITIQNATASTQSITLSPGGVIAPGYGCKLLWNGSSWTVTANGYVISGAASSITPGANINGILFTGASNITVPFSGMTQATNGTDANFTAITNSIKTLPASVLTANRTITFPTGNDGDQIIIKNNEINYLWLLSGSAVYLADNTTILTSLYANATHHFIKMDGRWTILN